MTKPPIAGLHLGDAIYRDSMDDLVKLLGQKG
jgi:hypothetical protein